MQLKDVVLPLEVGNEITIKQPVGNEFRQGNVLKITGFLNDDPDKILVDNLIPGGWIASDKIERQSKQLRFLTIAELILSHEHFYNIFLNFSNLNWDCHMSALPIPKMSVTKYNEKSIQIRGMLGSGTYELPYSQLTLAETPKLSERGFYFKLCPGTKVKVGDWSIQSLSFAKEENRGEVISIIQSIISGSSYANKITTSNFHGFVKNCIYNYHMINITQSYKKWKLDLKAYMQLTHLELWKEKMLLRGALDPNGYYVVNIEVTDVLPSSPGEQIQLLV